MVLGAALIIAILALFLVLQPDDSNDDDTTTSSAPAVTTGEAGTSPGEPAKPIKPTPPPVPTVTVKDGEPEGGVLELDLKEGDLIRFQVKSDVDEEIHVHGYDLSKDISAGGTVTFAFPADIGGIFEVELENSAVPIVSLQVNP
jgi:hypothetical protein